MSEPTDHATDLPQLKRLYRYLLERGQPGFASEVDDAFREIRGLREEADLLRAELTAATRRAELAEEALRGEYQSRAHPRPGTSAAPF